MIKQTAITGNEPLGFDASAQLRIFGAPTFLSASGDSSSALADQNVGAPIIEVASVEKI